MGRDRAVAGQRAIATVAAERAAAAPERPVRGKQLRAQGGTIIKHEGLTGPGISLGWFMIRVYCKEGVPCEIRT